MPCHFCETHGMFVFNREGRDDYWGWQSHAPSVGSVEQPEPPDSRLGGVRPLHGDSCQRSVVRGERRDADCKLRDRRLSPSASCRLGHHAVTVNITSLPATCIYVDP